MAMHQTLLKSFGLKLGKKQQTSEKVTKYNRPKNRRQGLALSDASIYQYHVMELAAASFAYRHVKGEAE